MRVECTSVAARILVMHGRRQEQSNLDNQKQLRDTHRCSTFYLLLLCDVWPFDTRLACTQAVGYVISLVLADCHSTAHLLDIS